MSKSVCLLLLFFVSSPLWSQVHWETMVKADESWNYFIGDSQPPSDWYSPGFDDSSWPSARGSFGFGDGHAETWKWSHETQRIFRDLMEMSQGQRRPSTEDGTRDLERIQRSWPVPRAVSGSSL